MKTIILLIKKMYKPFIKAYYRYVNDPLLILFRGLNRQAENLVKYLNKINKNIQFTLQILINN
jgi:hypothetical protein